LILCKKTDNIRNMKETPTVQAQPGGADLIELHATQDEKRLLTAAAAHERLDVNSFIMRAVLPTARDIVERAERLELSQLDSQRVLDLLENPPALTPALLAAARRRVARGGERA
jgi:uncharacterized protein (DUF1778 family)